MANSLPSPRQITRDIEPVVPGKTRERELQHDLAGTLRPVMASLGFFQPFQLATDIDEHLGKLGAHRIERAHDALLGGDDLVAQGRRVERGALAGHWSYELNRRLGLMTAYKAELGLMRRAKLRLRRTVPAAARSTSAVEAPNEDAKLAPRPGEPAR